MAVVRTYQCPEEDCGHQFRFMHMTADEPPPAHCPGCGRFMGEDPEPIPGAPAIIGAKGKSVDMAYNDLVKTSEVRAEMAGDPSLKITNLRDNLREGDVAAAPVNNAVTQYASEVGHNYFSPNVAGMATQDIVNGAKNGPERRTGEHVLKTIQGGSMNRAPVVPNVQGIKAGFGGA